MLYGLPVLPEALCVDHPDPNLWFGPHVCDAGCDGDQGCIKGKSEQGRYARIKEARTICNSCPERNSCLIWALETDQRYGIWGGRTERERMKLRRRSGEDG